MSDEFDTDKGVKDDYDGDVLEAYFKTGDNGDLSLVLKKRADDGEEVEDMYRVGTDWASFDGGDTCEHPTKTKVRADSQLAILFDHAFKAGAEQVIRERSEGKGQRTAKVWPGLRFHWDVEEKPYEFTDRKTGETVKGVSYKSYPTKYLGLSTESTGSSTPAAESSASSNGYDTSKVSAETLAKMKVLAQSKPYAEWVDECLTIDEARDNLLQALGDEGFYNSLKG